MDYWKTKEYWNNFEYDRSKGCICFGGGGQYSWGWVVNDFGDCVMPYSQVTGYGM